MDEESRKYTRVEFERRFLVSPDSDWQGHIQPYSKLLQDRYISGTRLRLREMIDLDSGRKLIKPTKKEASETPYFRRISRILLASDEFKVFAELDAFEIKKTRYYCTSFGSVFSIDVFTGELEGLILAEAEAESLDELMLIEPPPFVRCEVTENAFFDGGNLCRVSCEELSLTLQKVLTPQDL